MAYEIKRKFQLSSVVPWLNSTTHGSLHKYTLTPDSLGFYFFVDRECLSWLLILFHESYLGLCIRRRILQHTGLFLHINSMVCDPYHVSYTNFVNLVNPPFYTPYRKMFNDLWTDTMSCRVTHGSLEWKTLSKSYITAYGLIQLVLVLFVIH